MFNPFSLNTSTDEIGFEAEPGMQCCSYILRPESEGGALVTSADPAAPLAIDPAYLDTQNDRETAVAGTRAIRRIMEQDALKPFVVGETAASRRAERRRDPRALPRYRPFRATTPAARRRWAPRPPMSSTTGLRVRGVSGSRIGRLLDLPADTGGQYRRPGHGCSMAPVTDDHRGCPVIARHPPFTSRVNSPRNSAMTLIERHKKAAEMLPKTSSIIGGAAYSAAPAGDYEHINPATGQVQAGIPLSASLRSMPLSPQPAPQRPAGATPRITPPRNPRQLAELIKQNGED